MVTLEPVKVFASYRNSVIASVSQHLHLEGPRHLDSADNSANTQSTPLAYRGTPTSSRAETELLFETKYGLRLELHCGSNSYLIKICDSSPNAKPTPNLLGNTTIERTSPSIPKLL